MKKARLTACAGILALSAFSLTAQVAPPKIQPFTAKLVTTVTDDPNVKRVEFWSKASDGSVYQKFLGPTGSIDRLLIQEVGSKEVVRIAPAANLALRTPMRKSEYADLVEGFRTCEQAVRNVGPCSSHSGMVAGVVVARNEWSTSGEFTARIVRYLAPSLGYSLMREEQYDAAGKLIQRTEVTDLQLGEPDLSDYHAYASATVTGDPMLFFETDSRAKFGEFRESYRNAAQSITSNMERSRADGLLAK